MELTCKVTRGNLLESLHIVYGVAIDGDGNKILEVGNAGYVTCIRSAFKPFQAATSVMAGAFDAAGFSEDELALMCASHSGDEIHVKTARSMINKLGFDHSFYECGNHPPYDKDNRHKMIKDDTQFEPYHNNCSGKHAGMLALAKHIGADPKGYTLPEHPVQQLIMENAKRYTGLDEIPISIDGCSAVAPFFSLHTIAKLFQLLVNGEHSESERCFGAMAKYPHNIGGKGRFDTDFNDVLNGRGVTKIGGEAIRGVGIKTQKYGDVGIALKVLDFISISYMH
jgi:L-asparaginase II